VKDPEPIYKPNEISWLSGSDLKRRRNGRSSRNGSATSRLRSNSNYNNPTRNNSLVVPLKKELSQKRQSQVEDTSPYAYNISSDEKETNSEFHMSVYGLNAYQSYT